MAGLLPPVVTENFLGRAEIRETFTIPKVGTIAGSYVLEGNHTVFPDVRLPEGTVELVAVAKVDGAEVRSDKVIVTVDAIGKIQEWLG